MDKQGPPLLEGQVKSEKDNSELNMSIELSTPPKNPSIVKHRAQDSPANMRALATILDNSNLSADQALCLHNMEQQQSIAQSLPPPVINPQFTVDRKIPYPNALPYQSLQQAGGSQFHLPGNIPLRQFQNPLRNFYAQRTTSSVTQSRSLSISTNGTEVKSHLQSTESRGILCMATITADQIETMPHVFLQTVIEPNIGRADDFANNSTYLIRDLIGVQQRFVIESTDFD